MRTDVAVIGAGVIGLACARELGGAGVGVTVLETLDAPGRASSSRANGGVRAQFATAPNIAFSRFSIAAYETLETATGLLAFHQTGYLLLAGDAASERALRAGIELQRSHGVPTEWLEPDDALARAPFLRPDGLRGAAFHPRDGFLDPAGVVQALLAGAREVGVEVRTNATLARADRDADRWRLTLDGGETLAADIVVNAAGADARPVAALFGADVPVAPVRRNLALFLDAPGPLTPMVVDLDTGVLVRREVAGGWVVAYSDPADPPGRDTTLDPRFLEDLAARVGNRFPFLEDLPVDPARCWAGLYPETPDHHAIVGPAPEVAGLLHAIGFGGHGVMHAPAAGRAIAELATTGSSATFDLHPLRPERFAEGDLVVEPNVF
ncbi:MAG TPA: FAD-dependent oxidoreductase [Actinomycetota bacterium]